MLLTIFNNENTLCERSQGLWHHLPPIGNQIFNDFLHLGDYVNSKEYRKPEWITQMEEIQKRLSGKSA